MSALKRKKINREYDQQVNIKIILNNNLFMVCRIQGRVFCTLDDKTKIFQNLLLKRSIILIFSLIKVGKISNNIRIRIPTPHKILSEGTMKAEPHQMELRMSITCIGGTLLMDEFDEHKERQKKTKKT